MGAKLQASSSPSLPPSELRKQAKVVLWAIWEPILAKLQQDGGIVDVISEPELQDFVLALSDRSQTFPYVLPTQLLAKIVDSSLDARCLQKEESIEGDATESYVPVNAGQRFDPRSFCVEVIVPWNSSNNNIIGRSNDPYVSKPLRTPWLTVDTPHFRKMKFRDIWAALARILFKAQNEEAYAEKAFEQTLIILARRAALVEVDYRVPGRVSFNDSINLIEMLLSKGSGGVAAQAVATALLQVIGIRFGLWDQASTQHVNAADRTSGQVADITCFKNSNVILVCEVKDRAIYPREVDEKLLVLRGSTVRDALFLVRHGNESDREILDSILRRHFAGGLNGYVFDIIEFLQPFLAVLNEDGRKDFLVGIGEVLNHMAAPLPLRRRWAELLSSV